MIGLWDKYGVNNPGTPGRFHREYMFRNETMRLEYQTLHAEAIDGGVMCGVICTWQTLPNLLCRLHRFL
jgi:hypothetical protein